MSFKNCVQRFRTLAIGMLVLSLSACSQIIIPNAGLVDQNTVIGFAVPDEVYRLKPGDRVSMIVVPKGKLVNYKIGIGDEIDVLVQDREDLSTNYTVGPDGSIQLRQLKSMVAVGVSLHELQLKISAAYHAQGLESYVAIGFRKFNAPLTDFIRILSPSVQSNPFTTTLEVDGKANFPLIGLTDLANKTLKEANETVSKKYLELFDNADVTLRIEDSARHSITILGAVNSPGSYPIAGTAPLLTVLGAAKGYTDEARLDSIVTIQPRGTKMYVNKIDLEKDIIQLTDVKMISGDIIYVPKKPISNLNRFIDQYIRKNLPITTTFPISPSFF